MRRGGLSVCSIAWSKKGDCGKTLYGFVENSRKELACTILVSQTPWFKIIVAMKRIIDKKYIRDWSMS